MTQANDKARWKRSLLRRDGDMCKICGLKLGDDITIDHILARANGGTSRVENLQLVHFRCNNFKNTYIDQRHPARIKERSKG